jgi:hypothetical protein
MYVFGRLDCVGHSFAYVAHFCIFERCLDSNPESCRSMQESYQLGHPLTFQYKKFSTFFVLLIRHRAICLSSIQLFVLLYCTKKTRYTSATSQLTVPRARSRRLQRAFPAGGARVPGLRKKDVLESTGAHSHWLSESISKIGHALP